MIRLLLLFLALGTSPKGFGQLVILNKSLTDSSLAILYAGVNNQIEIISSPLEFQSISISKGSMKKMSPTSFIINANMTPGDQPGDTAILSLLSEGKIIGKKKYSIRALGRPFAKLGNINSSSATLNEVLANTKISVELTNCYYKHELVPLSYRIRISNEKTHFSYSHFNSKPDLYSEQIEILKNCIPGTMILLDWLVTNDKNNLTGWGGSTMIILR